QFLVGRLELFVGRLELLVGGLELLVRGLQLLVGRFHVLVEPLKRRLKILRVRRVDEADRHADRLLVAVAQRRDLHVEVLRRSIGLLAFDLRNGDRRALRVGLLDQRAKLERPKRYFEILQWLADIGWRDPKRLAGDVARQHDAPLRSMTSCDTGTASIANWRMSI